MNNLHTVCGKYGPHLPSILERETPLRRTFRTTKRIAQRPPIDIGVDETTVWMAGSRFSHIEFLQRDLNHQLCTLTKREASILLETGLLRSEVISFESKYPWVSKIKYVNCSERNFWRLTNLRKKYEKHLETSGEMANAALKQVMRKVNWKSELDQYFFLAQDHAYQEAFKLVEGRSGRSILAFDFNSMYAACLEGEFPDPKSLNFQQFGIQASELHRVPPGLFKCTLSAPNSEFIKRFHSFRFNTYAQKFPFLFGASDVAQILLHTCEIEFYREHFDSLIIEWGIVSDKPVAHPLRNLSRRTYSDRLNYKMQRNETLSAKNKFRLATLFSCVAQRRKKSLTFDTLDELLHHVREHYQLEKPKGMSSIQFVQHINRLPAFSIYIDQKYKLNCPNPTHPENILSLYSPVIANGRIKMLRCIEYVLKFNGAEICYSNVDSVHVSIPDDKQVSFLEHMKPLLSDKCGDLKLEAYAQKGVWFEPGRYWLFSDGNIVKHRNIGIRGKWAPSPFLMAKRHTVTTKLFGYFYPKSFFISFFRALTFRKKIVDCKDDQNLYFERFEARELEETKWMTSVTNETNRSAKIKKSVFQSMPYLATSSSGHAKPLYD